MDTPKEKAQRGLALIKEAIAEFVAQHKDGVAHSMIVHHLGLESDFEGAQQNYLSWSVFGLLVNEQRIRYVGRGRSKRYFSA